MYSIGFFGQRCATAILLSLLAACAGQHRTPLPWPEPVIGRHTDGVSDDLLSAGLGLDGLRAAPPAVRDPAAPAVDELRRLALYHAWRGLHDVSAGSDLETAARPDGKPLLAPIAGTELLSTVRLGAERAPAALLLQIPEAFDWQRPCLVATASSGSRGVYGAIVVIAPWALARGCALVTTDKGAGNGVYLPEFDLGLELQGRLTAPKSALFALDRQAPQTAAYLAAHPHRIAFRHAHSQENPEADWGRYVLAAIDFARREINLRRPNGVWLLTPERTQIIAAGISNGGGAVLAAAEQDTVGLIDGVVAAEPNAFVEGARPLVDYAGAFNLYAPCAALALPGDHPFGVPLAGLRPLLLARCRAMHNDGLLAGGNEAEWAAAALQALHDEGLPEEADALLPFAVVFELYSSIAVTYTSAAGRFAYADPPCGIGFAALNGAGRAVTIANPVAAALFATSTGIVPTAGIGLVETAETGTDQRAILVPPAAGEAPDFAYRGALCLRRLWDGKEPRAAEVRAGVAATQQSGDLRGRPAIVVHGGADTVVPVVHSSRPYLARNRLIEGENSRLRYFEVAGAQHFDALLALPAYRQKYRALYPYFLAALDALDRHLQHQAPLPETLLDTGLYRAAPAAGE